MKTGREQTPNDRISWALETTKRSTCVPTRKEQGARKFFGLKHWGLIDVSGKQLNGRSTQKILKDRHSWGGHETQKEGRISQRKAEKTIQTLTIYRGGEKASDGKIGEGGKIGKNIVGKEEKRNHSRR